MKKILYFILISALCACEKETPVADLPDPDAIGAYIQVPDTLWFGTDQSRVDLAIQTPYYWKITDHQAGHQWQYISFRDGQSVSGRGNLTVPVFLSSTKSDAVREDSLWINLYDTQEFGKPFLSKKVYLKETGGPAMSKAGGDGQYDQLGYGYDATQEYVNPGNDKNQIIDIQRILRDHPDLVNVNNSQGQEEEILSAETAEAYCYKLTTEFTAGGVKDGILFGNSVSSSKFQKDTISGRYAFASYRKLIRKRSVSLTFPVDSLKKYLTTSFLSYLKAGDTRFIIDHFGTHVLTNIILGASLNIYYSSQIESFSRLEIVEAGIKYVVGGIFNIDTSVKTENSMTKQNKSQHLKYRTWGGNSSISLAGEIDLNGGSLSKINIAAWQSSCNTTNMVLIGFGNTRQALIPIYELVDDPAMKSKLKSAVNQYIAERTIQSTPYIIPIYRFVKSGRNYQHFFSNDKNQFAVNSKGYASEGVKFYLYSPVAAPNAGMPIYRFVTDDSCPRCYLTSSPDDKSVARYGYRLDQLIGYAVRTLTNTITLNKYGTSASDPARKFFYSTNYSEMKEGKDGFSIIRPPLSSPSFDPFSEIIMVPNVR